MDPATQRRMRTAHAKYHETCVCGLVVNGNGRKSHFRACGKYLANIGWPLDAAMGAAIRDEYRGRSAEVIRHVERGLGQFYLDRRHSGDKSELPWLEFKALVWKLADEYEAV